MTPHEERFRTLIQSLLRIGVTPTPTKINRFLGRTQRRKSNNINGREAAWRREEMLAAGWIEPIPVIHPYHTAQGRWKPPS